MKKAKLFILLLIACCSSAFAERMLVSQDAPKVIAELFSYHIENKTLTPALVRRCIKVYLEQFDPEKIYLIDEEVYTFLSLSDEEAEEMGSRMRDGNFSDFVAINNMIQKAVLRFQENRVKLANELTNVPFPKEPDSAPNSQYAQNEQELRAKQKDRIVRLYAYHNKKAPIDSSDKRKKFFALLERKWKRQENAYLSLHATGAPMNEAQKEHYLVIRILKSFAKSLDAHTTFFSEEEATEMRMNLEKQFEGLGIVLSEGVDGIQITEIIANSPAAKSGQININDVLVEIDGVPLKDSSFELALSLLKKRDKNNHVLGIERVDASGIKQKFFRVDLKKAPIVMDQDRIKYSLEPYENGYIGRITMNSFYENGEGITSEKDLKEAIRKMKEQGNLLGLILDFRENAGGFLSQAVKVSSLFMSSGVVVISKYSEGKVHYLRSLDPKVYYNGPLIILTSKLSASAAEIVAQALQDYGAALVVGDERTFGKGSIQYQTVTDMGAQYYYKVTVGKYYTVSGRTTQIDGVKADIVVPSTYAPFPIGERYLEYPLQADRLPAAYNDSLSDVDMKVRIWFQKNYTPFQQKKVTTWQKMLPELKRNSATRISNNSKFRTLLESQARIKAKLENKELYAEELKNLGSQDLQIEEATSIMKDMLDIQKKQHTVSEQEESFPQAG